MPEWWTYGLSDFLMFSPQAYWSLLARHNAAWWPAQGLGIAAALALPWLVRIGAVRTVLVLLAAAWAWAGWSFYWQRYAEIFLAAPWLAAGSGLQAVLLLAAAALRPGTAAAAAPRGGMLLLVLALAYPLLAPLTGRRLAEAEVFGLFPDPTALATLGALLALPGLARGWRVVLAIVPLLVVLLAGATRWLLA
jgi:hypothetical protein